MKRVWISFLLCLFAHPLSADPATPYLLPDNHPIKQTLDRIFNRARITLNVATFSSAGFQIIAHHKVSNCIVAKHLRIKGYIFKLFFDEQENHVHPEQLVTRAYGAESLQQAITLFGYDSLFKVPHKWIYLLPEEPSLPSDAARQHFILVEEEMDIVSEPANKALWKSRKVNEKLLTALYNLLTDQGLSDSNHYFNISFCKDGKIAFFDTERNHIYPVHVDQFLEDLGAEGQIIWKELMK